MSVYNDQAKIFIGHLPIDITESELEYHFRPYGYIKSLYIIKSYAFIEYGNNDSAKNAISDMNNSKLNGKKIIVQKALNEREKRERLNEKKNEDIINISNNSLSSSPLSKKKNEISNRINKKCSICSKIDHNTSECNYLKENKKIYDKNNSRDYFKECFKCGSINHLERDCPFIIGKVIVEVEVKIILIQSILLMIKIKVIAEHIQIIQEVILEVLMMILILLILDKNRNQNK